MRSRETTPGRRVARALAASMLVVAFAAGCALVPRQGPDPAPVDGGAVVRLPVMEATPGSPRVLVVVSVAGLTTAHAGRPDAMPVLAALASAGVVARDTERVVPASPYAIHATLVTGRPPADHGILGDRLITDDGLSRVRPWDVTHYRAPTLWEAAERAGRRTVALDWPTTRGADVAAVLPDTEPVDRGQTWIAAIAEGTSPWLLALAQAAPPAVSRPGAERDSFLVSAACVAVRDANPPGLVMMRLRGAEGALRTRGPGGDVVEAAFRRLDRDLARLIACLEGAPALAAGGALDAAVVVVGDRAFQPVHTAIRPNRILAEAGLVEPGGAWRALFRTHGGSADLYAQTAEDALAARDLLEEMARESGGFRVVSAEERIAHGADPQAWLGLEAAPGFALLDGARGPALSPAPGRGAAGYLAPGGATPAFVAFGRGFRRELVAPTVHQLDVAPTLARLLDLPLPDAAGRHLIGLLRVPGPVAAAPPDDGEFDE